MNKIIGILGMQGAIAEHQEILLQIPHTKIRIVKTAKDLDCIDGLILPGGESTAIGKLLDYFSLKEILRQKNHFRFTCIWHLCWLNLAC